MVLINIFQDLQTGSHFMATKNQPFTSLNKSELLDTNGCKIGIVVSEWNKQVTDKLYEGAYNTLIESGLNRSNISTLHVPGSFELVYGAKFLANKEGLDCVICLGSIIKGETPHFDYVCNAVSLGIKDLNIHLSIPVIFGVLTDNNLEQALDRSGGKFGNKGIESAITAIKMVNLNFK